MATSFCDDPETQALVSGFIRGMQQILPSNSTFYIIPALVHHLLLQFYFITEYFVKCGSQLKITNDGMIVASASSSRYQTAYGLVSINPNYNYCWKFKIIQGGTCIFIGISSKKDINVETGIEWQDGTDDYYAFSNGGGKYDINNKYGVWTDESRGFGVNNYVIMRVNPSKQTVRFSASDKKETDSWIQDFTFKNVNFKDKTYKMTIAIGAFDSAVELIKFTKEVASL